MFAIVFKPRYTYYCNSGILFDKLLANRKQFFVKNLWIEPGCITCGACEFAAPEVFEVTDLSHIKPDVPLCKYAQAIKEAAAMCPVQVIKFEE